MKISDILNAILNPSTTNYANMFCYYVNDKLMVYDTEFNPVLEVEYHVQNEQTQQTQHNETHYNNYSKFIIMNKKRFSGEYVLSTFKKGREGSWHSRDFDVISIPYSDDIEAMLFQHTLVSDISTVDLECIDKMIAFNKMLLTSHVDGVTVVFNNLSKIEI